MLMVTLIAALIGAAKTAPCDLKLTITHTSTELLEDLLNGC
jgi:hypothetical protein